MNRSTHESAQTTLGSREDVVPRISVVIPTHNRASLVPRAIHSVLSQDVNELAVVVVDDGSTDHTREICEAIGDPRVLYVAQPKRGANAARNLGARVATTEFLTWLDSDDEALPGWLRALLDAFDEGADVVTCGCLATSAGEERIVLPKDMGPAFEHAVALFAHGGTYALRRRLFFEVGGFGDAVPAAQHTELAYRLIPHLQETNQRMDAIMRPLIRYRVGTPDGVRSNHARVLAGARYLVDQHGGRLLRDPALYANHCAVVGVRAVRLRQMPVAREYFRKAVRMDRRRLRNWGRLAVSYISPIAKQVWR